MARVCDVHATKRKIISKEADCRRGYGEPFLAAPSDSILAVALPLRAINSAASVLETALARPLFPIRYEKSALHCHASSSDTVYRF